MQLNKKKTSNSSKPEDRTTKMHNKDCQLMGLTWLLAKNRTAYIHTVSAVLRAIMMSNDGSHPQSCALNSDGMPLAVDSSEISGHSSSNNLRAPINLCPLLLCLLYLLSILLSTQIHQISSHSFMIVLLFFLPCNMRCPVSPLHLLVQLIRLRSFCHLNKNVGILVVFCIDKEDVWSKFEREF